MAPLMLLTSLLLPLFPVLLFVAILRIFFRKRRVAGSFAFFHPYCDAGGGGERVLWLAVNAIQSRFSKSHPNLRFVIYTGDVDKSAEQIVEKAHSRFGISVRTDCLRFVYLRWRWLLESCNYPRFTLIGQLFGGLLLGAEALWCHSPQWFIDTTGCPLTLPLFRWIGGANTLCYVHYPTITTEMIRLVGSRTASYNNSPTIAASGFLSSAKVVYYQLIALLYRACGNSAQLVMVNGSWTSQHISHLWGGRPIIVFPPCDVETLMELERKSEKTLLEENHILILSVGQIRPEKNHLKQLRIFAEVRQRLKERNSKLKVKLVIAGGCRDEGDWDRVNFLKKYAMGNYGLESDTELGSARELIWRLNIPFKELTKLLQESMIGLHTMWNEHFGISVVEGMAAGTIMVAHNSGGPKMDIIGDGLMENDVNIAKRCGFLADTEEEYASTILQIVDLEREGRDEIRMEAQRKAKCFSDQIFEQNFCTSIGPILSQPSENDAE